MRARALDDADDQCWICLDGDTAEREVGKISTRPRAGQAGDDREIAGDFFALFV